MLDNERVQRWTGDPGTDAYLAELVVTARRELGEAFVGAYLANSGARADYIPGRSDLDVETIVEASMRQDAKRRLADALRHGALPCPAPRLELVVYRREVAASAGPRPAFEINLNTGPAIADHVSYDPEEEPPHWFVLDLAAAADAALALAGPDPSTIFGPVSRPVVLDALKASDAWHTAHDTVAPNRVLNACRAWCYVTTGRWESKTAAANWAIAEGGDEALIRQALAARLGRDEPMDAGAVGRFALSVAALVERAEREGED